ncbi:hypothetical protein KC887_09270, partial [Candidatus Kaiserbacteria bacterium]|nr:hypothetical protein [Candidatus Kaiserbacteria bacterium]
MQETSDTPNRRRETKAHNDEKEILRQNFMDAAPSLKGKYACDENTQYERAILLTNSANDDKDAYERIGPFSEEEMKIEGEVYYYQPRETWQESYRTCGLVPNILNVPRVCTGMDKQKYQCRFEGEGESRILLPADIYKVSNMGNDAKTLELAEGSYHRKTGLAEQYSEEMLRSHKAAVNMTWLSTDVTFYRSKHTGECLTFLGLWKQIEATEWKVRRKFSVVQLKLINNAIHYMKKGVGKSADPLRNRVAWREHGIDWRGKDGLMQKLRDYTYPAYNAMLLYFAALIVYHAVDWMLSCEILMRDREETTKFLQFAEYAGKVAKLGVNLLAEVLTATDGEWANAEYLQRWEPVVNKNGVIPIALRNLVAYISTQDLYEDEDLYQLPLRSGKYETAFDILDEGQVMRKRNVQNICRETAKVLHIQMYMYALITTREGLEYRHAAIALELATMRLNEGLWRAREWGKRNGLYDYDKGRELIQCGKYVPYGYKTRVHAAMMPRTRWLESLGLNSNHDRFDELVEPIQRPEWFMVVSGVTHGHQPQSDQFDTDGVDCELTDEDV